jgi:hypothetical protein
MLRVVEFDVSKVCDRHERQTYQSDSDYFVSMNGGIPNWLALGVALLLIAGGLLWLQSRPEEDACGRWQRLVVHEAELLASQHKSRRPESFYAQAARTFGEDRPVGCDSPTPDQANQ